MLSRVLAPGLDGAGGKVHGLDVRRTGSHGEGKSALVAEAVDDFAMRILARLAAILALVEEAAGLLTFEEIVGEFEAVFARDNLLGDFAREQRHVVFEAFEQAHLRVVALEDAPRGEELGKDFGEFRFATVGALAEGLHHEVIAVAVYDVGGDAVAAGIDEPVDFRVFNDALAIGGGGADAFGQVGAVNWYVGAGEQADRNLRAIAVECPAEEA